MSDVIYADPRTQAFRRTLDRLPDEIALAIGLRVEHLLDPDTCVCGWAMRVGLALATGVPAEEVRGSVNSEIICQRLYGGSYSEWADVFVAFKDGDTTSRIEEALFDRVMAAALASKSRRRPSRVEGQR
jgi:hypothetical protein